MVVGAGGGGSSCVVFVSKLDTYALFRGGVGKRDA